MKLVRFGLHGQEKPGVLDAKGNIRDLSSYVDDISGPTLTASALSALAAIDLETLPAVPRATRIGPPLGHVGKLICVGLNYSDHAAESGMQIPKEPVIFMKATSAISGPNDDVILPFGSEKLDWEVELGVVVGKLARRVAATSALEHVAGYVIVNDVSERAWQLERNGQWTKGKSHDTFAPTGPWLVTSDEIADPQNLSCRLSVNGVLRQNGSTANMIFDVAHLISYLSQFMTLCPGDVISTGTPAGVGFGFKPPVYLKDGDVMTLEIEGLGSQRQRVTAASRETGVSAV